MDDKKIKEIKDIKDAVSRTYNPKKEIPLFEEMREKKTERMMDHFRK